MSVPCQYLLQVLRVAPAALRAGAIELRVLVLVKPCTGPGGCLRPPRLSGPGPGVTGGRSHNGIGTGAEARTACATESGLPSHRQVPAAASHWHLQYRDWRRRIMIACIIPSIMALSLRIISETLRRSDEGVKPCAGPGCLRPPRLSGPLIGSRSHKGIGTRAEARHWQRATPSSPGPSHRRARTVAAHWAPVGSHHPKPRPSTPRLIGNFSLEFRSISAN